MAGILAVRTRARFRNGNDKAQLMSKEVPSELELFLQGQQSDGVADSSGEFTLARDKALQKLSEFQLPFKGAWAVKVFQSLIRVGLDKPLEVKLTSKVSTFTCQLPKSMTAESIESSYFNPEPSEDLATRHLISALWAIGINQKRGFQLTLPGEETTLFWNGKEMSRLEKAPDTAFFLSVTHQPAGDNWLANPIRSSLSNSNISTALREHCFTSPVPLSVDNVRIDGLHHCKSYGWSGKTFPLTLVFSEGDLNPVRWPPGTFEALDNKRTSYVKDGCGLEGLTRRSLEKIPVTKSSGLATLITANADQRDATVWKIRKRKSRCFWIQDGAVVQSEFFDLEESGVSVGCYLCAADIPNDLTGFYLAEHAERERRKREAARLAAEPIHKMNSVAVDAIKAHNSARYHKLGNAYMLLAFGIGWKLPVLGLPVACVVGVFGLFARFATRAEEATFLKSLSKELNELDLHWKRMLKKKIWSNGKSSSEKKKKRPKF